jgi:WD40 repeat protein
MHIQELVFSPDNRQIVSVSDDGKLYIHDPATGNPAITLCGHKYGVISLAYSPDGNWIASTSSDKSVKLWSARTGSLETTLAEFYYATYGTFACSFSPDGERIIWATDYQRLHLWDVTRRTHTFDLQGHSFAERACCFSPDGRRIVAAWRFSLTVWDANSGQELLELTGPKDTPTSCAYSPDSRLIVSANHVWNADTGELFMELSETMTCRYDPLCNYSPDGRYLCAVNGNTLNILHAGTGSVAAKLVSQPSRIRAYEFSPNGRWIAFLSEDGLLRIWQWEKDGNLLLFPGNARFETMAVSHTGQVIAVGDTGGRVSFLRPLKNVEPPCITAMHLYRFKQGRYDDDATAKCSWCGKRFVPNESVCNTIKTLNAYLTPDQSPCLELPDEAWNEPRLLSECPHCHAPLRFNPFIVDNRGRYR